MGNLLFLFSLYLIISRNVVKPILVDSTKEIITGKAGTDAPTSLSETFMEYESVFNESVEVMPEGSTTKYSTEDVPWENTSTQLITQSSSSEDVVTVNGVTMDRGNVATPDEFSTEDSIFLPEESDTSEFIQSTSDERSTIPPDWTLKGLNPDNRAEDSTSQHPISTSRLNISINNNGSLVDAAGKLNSTTNPLEIRGNSTLWPVKHASVMEGDVILGGLMMVHSREDSITCGPIMPQGGIQALEAMLYTLDRINAIQFLPNITLGAHILDDCDKDTYGLEMAVDFIKGKTMSNFLDVHPYHPE